MNIVKIQRYLLWVSPVVVERIKHNKKTGLRKGNILYENIKQLRVITGRQRTEQKTRLKVIV